MVMCIFMYTSMCIIYQLKPVWCENAKLIITCSFFIVFASQFRYIPLNMFKSFKIYIALNLYVCFMVTNMIPVLGIHIPLYVIMLHYVSMVCLFGSHRYFTNESSETISNNICACIWRCQQIIQYWTRLQWGIWYNSIITLRADSYLFAIKCSIQGRQDDMHRQLYQNSMCYLMIVGKHIPISLWAVGDLCKYHYNIIYSRWGQGTKRTVHELTASTQITKFIGPTWNPPGSCRPQTGPMLVPWTLLSGYVCWTDARALAWIVCLRVPSQSIPAHRFEMWVFIFEANVSLFLCARHFYSLIYWY